MAAWGRYFELGDIFLYHNVGDDILEFKLPAFAYRNLKQETGISFGGLEIAQKINTLNNIISFRRIGTMCWITRAGSKHETHSL